jgi:hypothetical protein
VSPFLLNMDKRVGAVRAYLEHRTRSAAALWVGSVLAGVLVAAWIFSGPEGWRQGSDVPLALDLLLILVIVVGLRLLRRGTRQWFSEAPLASAMEHAASLKPGTVRGSLELARRIPKGVSESLAGHAAQRALGDLDRPDSELAGTLGHGVRSWIRRGTGLMVAMAVVLTTLAIMAPSRAGRAWAGLSTPLSIMADPVLPSVQLSPGSVEVLRGSNVLVRVEAPSRETVDLVWQSAGDVGHTETLVLTDGVAERTFQRISAAIEYGVRTPDGAATQTYRLTPVDPLFVGDFRVEVAYPPHTGLPPEEFRGTVPPLSLPVGTRLNVDGRASRDLSEAALADSSGVEVFRLSVDGSGFVGSWRPRLGGRFFWSFLDGDGQAAATQPDPLELVLLLDSAPAVSIPLPGRDTILPLTLKQPLVLEAHDDYGLRRLELVAFRVTALGESQEPVVQGLDLGGTRAALARPLLDLGAWGLLPGDQVRYFARAIDNSPAAQVATSPEYVLRMPLASELRREAEEQLDEMAQRLEELAAKAGERAEETRDLEREAAAEEAAQRAGADEELGFEEREELRQALEGQEELTAEVDSLSAELQALEETMREAGQADPDLREDMAELQELLEQIAGDQLRERLQEMSEALDEQDAAEANEALRELAKEQESFRERLEESLERFRRAAVEQDFRATESEAEELARQERALADALREDDQPELRARQQEELQERAQELQERMKGLQERLEKLDEKPAAQEVGEARNQAEQAGEEMQGAQQRAEQGQSQEAGEKADEAAEALEKAAEQLQEAQQQMAQQKAEAAQQALRQAADEALSLARRQSELREEIEGASQDRVTEMRSDEASLLQGVRNLAQNLQTATEGATAGDQELSAQMGRAMESLQRTIQAMENRRGPTPSPTAAAEQAVDDLNQLALMAMAGAEQMGQQGQQGQGGEEVSEQLEELAQQQGDLVNQTGQLTPLQLGEQAMREQLQRLAEEQRDVAEDLGDLSEEENAPEESLGDLGELAQEAEELARQLAQGRLTPETLQRQERLFHRLLDAGRSLEKDEEISDERESEQAGAFDRADVVPLGAGQLGALRFELPNAEQLQRLSPAVRQLVIQYFERLNRGGDGDPSGAEGGNR